MDDEYEQLKNELAKADNGKDIADILKREDDMVKRRKKERSNIADHITRVTYSPGQEDSDAR